MKRAILISLALQFIPACSITRMLPKGPVLSNSTRLSIEKKAPLSIEYKSKPRVLFPILPIMAFGITYELDIVIVSKHPTWNMHEFAKISTPDGPIWLAKDAYEGSLDQCITSSRKDPYSLLPEIPVKMKYWPIKVQNHSKPGFLDISIEYENHDGEMVQASYKGIAPGKKMTKRNGSTMGHSKNQLLAVLDVSTRDQGKEARISYNGKSYDIKKILGIVPFQMVLKQTQGGLATGLYQQQGTNQDMTSTHVTVDGNKITQAWKIIKSKTELTAIQKNKIRTIKYTYIKNKDSLELKSIIINQWEQKNNVVSIHFFPPLPDIRKHFKKTHRSTYVIDVNGQKNHAIGYIDSISHDNAAEIRVIPLKPWWTRDRPLNSYIQFIDNKKVTISTSRTR